MGTCLLQTVLCLALPCFALCIASSSLHLPLVALDPSNIPEHVDMSSYPSPTSSPSESPWGSNSDLRRLPVTTGSGAQEVWGQAKPLKPSGLRRTVSVSKRMAEKRMDLAYEAAHSCQQQGLKRMEHEYRRVSDPSRLKAPIPVYTQLQQSLYPELQF